MPIIVLFSFPAHKYAGLGVELCVHVVIEAMVSVDENKMNIQQ